MSQGRWLVSYADFITLMFAAFTVLYASSAADAGKLASMKASLTQAFDPGPERATAVVDPTLLEAATRTRELARLRAQLTDRLAPGIAAALVAVRLDGRGLVISLHEAGTFATGSADLSRGALALIDTVASAIAPIDNVVRVEGHTDDVPIATVRYRSNWELSTARATSVVTYLVAEGGIPAERFAIAGYGEFRPYAPNDSTENRTKNRRVDIVVLSSQTASAEEPPFVAPEVGDA